MIAAPKRLALPAWTGKRHGKSKLFPAQGCRHHDSYQEMKKRIVLFMGILTVVVLGGCTARNTEVMTPSNASTQGAGVRDASDVNGGGAAAAAAGAQINPGH
jgi:hypothetical protein